MPLLEVQKFKKGWELAHAEVEKALEAGLLEELRANFVDQEYPHYHQFRPRVGLTVTVNDAVVKEVKGIVLGHPCGLFIVENPQDRTRSVWSRPQNLRSLVIEGIEVPQDKPEKVTITCEQRHPTWLPED